MRPLVARWKTTLSHEVLAPSGPFVIRSLSGRALGAHAGWSCGVRKSAARHHGAAPLVGVCSSPFPWTMRPG
jgi:hypothetical protein